MAAFAAAGAATAGRAVVPGVGGLAAAGGLAGAAAAGRGGATPVAGLGGAAALRNAGLGGAAGAGGGAWPCADSPASGSTGASPFDKASSAAAQSSWFFAMVVNSARTSAAAAVPPGPRPQRDATTRAFDKTVPACLGYRTNLAPPLSPAHLRLSANLPRG